MPRGSQNGSWPVKCPRCWAGPQVGPAAPAPWQGGTEILSMQGVSTSAPPCSKLVAVLHCRAPWCRSDCMEHHSRNITGKGVQAAIAGCTWVGLAALMLHAALQARAQPNEAGDALLQAPPWSEPHTLAAADLFCILHTIAFPLFPILAEKTRVLFPPSLAVPSLVSPAPSLLQSRAAHTAPRGRQRCAGLLKCSSKPRAGLGSTHWLRGGDQGPCSR